MKRKYSLTLLAVVMGLGFLIPETAEARHGYGYGQRPAPRRGYGPQRVRPYSYRHRPHFVLGAKALGMATFGHQHTVEEGHVGPGGGIGIFAGYRLGPWISLEGKWTLSVNDMDWDNGAREYDALQIHSFMADVKIHIPTWSRIEPFVQAGGGYSFMGWNDEYATEYIFSGGPTFNIGGGAEMWFSPFFSLGGTLLYKGTYFSDGNYRVEGREYNSNFVSALQFDLFLALHF